MVKIPALRAGMSFIETMLKEYLTAPQKNHYENSIIPDYLTEELQELFNEAIPRIVERIREEGVTHLLLTERTARLFKFGFRKIFDLYDLDDVKIGSIAPDYFLSENENEASQEQRKRKLDFIRNDLKSGHLEKVMVLDEYTESGDSLENVREGLEKLFGLSADQVLTDYIQKAGPGDEVVVEAIYDNVDDIFTNEVNHAQLKGEKAKEKYKDTVRQIADMMEEAMGNYEAKYSFY